MTLVLQGQGTPADAGTWRKIGAVSSLKYISGDTTIDAVRMKVQDLIYGVVFSFTVARSVYDEAGWQALAGEYAAKVQAIGSFVGTQGIQYVPETSPSGQITDNLIVTVGTDDWFVLIDVEIPLATSDTPAVSAKYVDAYNAGIADLAVLS